MGTRPSTIGEDERGLYATGELAAPPDLTVAVTEYELRQLLAELPYTHSLPVAMRGDVLVISPSCADMGSLVTLARLRGAVTGPEAAEDASDAQEPAQAQEAAALDARLSRLADDMQERVESFLSNLGVDPQKYDHQNHAGDLVGALLAVLRRHDLLTEPVAYRLPTGRPLRRMLNTEEAGAVRRAVHRSAPAGLGPQQITQITGDVLATLRGLTEEP